MIIQFTTVSNYAVEFSTLGDISGVIISEALETHLCDHDILPPITIHQIHRSIEQMLQKCIWNNMIPSIVIEVL